MKYNTRHYIGHVYRVQSGKYHAYEIGTEVKIVDIKDDICDCVDSYGCEQYVFKSDLGRCKFIGKIKID